MVSFELIEIVIRVIVRGRNESIWSGKKNLDHCGAITAPPRFGAERTSCVRAVTYFCLRFQTATVATRFVAIREYRFVTRVIPRVGKFRRTIKFHRIDHHSPNELVVPYVIPVTYTPRIERGQSERSRARLSLSVYPSLPSVSALKKC